MSVTPEYLIYQLNLLQVSNDLQEDILRDIIRRLKKTNLSVTDTAAWEFEKLQQAGKLEEDILSRIAAAIPLQKKEIKDMFSDMKAEVFDYESDGLEIAGYDAQDFKHFSPQMIQSINAALKKTTTAAINLTKTTAVTTQPAFLVACDLAHQGVISGVYSYQQAIVKAVDLTVAKEGVTVIYPSGHSENVAVAARRAILTGVNQTAGQLQSMRADEFDIDLMEITAHSGARERHAVWQGQIVSRSGQKGYLTLSDIGYGEVTGFMGANCRHNWHMFFDGISNRAYSDTQLDEFKNATVSYNEEKLPVDKALDKQRGFERAIRKTKEELVCYDECIQLSETAAGKLAAQTAFDKTAVKLKQQEYRLKDFCNQTGLQLDNFRVQMFSAETENGFKGFGKSVSGKAVFSSQKHYDDWKKSIGAESLPKTLAKYYDMKYNNKDEYDLLQRYANSVSKGMISPLSTYSNYTQQLINIEKELIGITTSDGIKITAQSKHLIDRIIGSSEDPTKRGKAAQKPREGVSVEDIKEALTNPIRTGNIITDEKGNKSIKYYSEKCNVSINSDTGILIQVNPYH